MSKNNSQIDWNSRFSIQASWTKPLREYLISQLGFTKNSKILELGCGTATILRELTDSIKCHPIGIDIDLDRLRIGQQLATEQLLLCADGNSAPFPDESFDFIIFHYFLLWIKNPDHLLNSVKRLLVPGGMIVAFAEPDYKSRIEFPKEFEKIGNLQTKSLIKQGINPLIGRQLPGLLSKAGFRDIQFGISGFQKPMSSIPEDNSSEWIVLANDLIIIGKKTLMSKYQDKDQEAIEKGERVSWVPTFYAYGKK